MRFLSTLTVLGSLAAGFVSALPAGQRSDIAERDAGYKRFENFAVTNIHRRRDALGGIPEGVVLEKRAKPGQAAAKPAGKPAGKPVGAPAGKPVGAPAGKPAGAPAGKPVGAPAGKPAGAPAGKPAGAPAGKPAGAPAGKPAGAPAGKPAGGTSASASSAGGGSSTEGTDKLTIYKGVVGRARTYTKPGLDFKKLDDLQVRLGGAHVVVVVGSQALGYKEYDLLIKDSKFAENKDFPNGNGQPTEVGEGDYPAADLNKLTEVGKTKTLKTLRAIYARGERINKNHGEVYNVDDFNCETFADELIKDLKDR